MIPVSQTGGQLVLAISEPPQLTEQGNLRLLLGKRLRFSIATPSDIHAVIKRYFGLGADTIQQLREGEAIQGGPQEVVFDLTVNQDLTQG